MIRKANLRDLNFLVEIYNKTYNGGYSLLFDYYGSVDENQFLKILKKKDFFVFANTGFFVFGDEGRLTLEECILQCKGIPSWNFEVCEEDEKHMEEVYEFVEEYFKEKNRDKIVLRTVENNPFSLLLAKKFKFQYSASLIISEKNLNKAFEVNVLKGYKLREYKDGDEYQFSEIHKKCFGEKISKKEFRKWIKKGKGFVLEKGEVVGFVIAEVRDGIGDWTISILKKHRGKGLGKALLYSAFNFFLESNVQKVFADYWAENFMALEFYRKHGFERKRIYIYFEKVME
ncbi:MAG: GNAT family N-acetyltransferase [Candidatus Methanofastidiosia archaeon]